MAYKWKASYSSALLSTLMCICAMVSSDISVRLYAFNIFNQIMSFCPCKNIQVMKLARDKGTMSLLFRAESVYLKQNSQSCD